MSKINLLVLAAAACSLLTSCFKDEPLNAECDIEMAYLHADNPLEIFVKPTDSIATTNETSRTIIFSVRKGTNITALAPQFQLTEGATISPANGSVHDFSKGAVSYTVTSENGAWQKTYNVRFDEKTSAATQFSFENLLMEPDRERYYIWTDKTEDGTDMLNWASGNSGFAIVGGNASPYEYPTAPYENGYEGKGVKLTTRSTGEGGAIFKMPIAAGNLFTGSFDANKATKRPLEATHFGDGPYCVVNKKPLVLTGYYQYTPGKTITDKAGKEVPGIDQGDIYAVLFRNSKADGTPFYLDGSNVKTSEQIVALALVGPLDKTEGGWHKFSKNFEYIANFDPQVLEAGGYSMTVVFTSSVGGAEFVGAVGSELLIDEVKVIMEE